MSASFEDLDAKQIVSLPIDRLAIAVLRHLDASNAWNTGNFLLEQRPRYQDDAAERALIVAEPTRCAGRLQRRDAVPITLRTRS